MAGDRVLDGLLQDVRASLDGEGAEPPAEADRPGLERLAPDLAETGLFGLLATIAGAPDPTDEVFLEVRRRIEDRVRAGLREEGVTEAEAALLPELLRLYAERKGSRGPDLLRKLVANAIFEFYELKEHGLFVDDVSRIFDLYRSGGGTGDDIRAFFRALMALSSETARFMLGLFPGQMPLIFRIGQRAAERKEIDAALDEFAPAVVQKRLFAVVKSLLQKEKRFRLACIVWARLHGIALGREHLDRLEPVLAVKDTKELVKRALETAPARERWLQFRRARAADVAALEGVL